MLSLLIKGWRTRRLLSRFQGGYPTFLIYQTTERCNARCCMCSIWQKESGSRTPEMTLPQLRQTLGQALFQKVEYFHMTGGEPFLLTDFTERIRTAVECLPKMRVLMLASNGFLTEKIERDMRASLTDFPRVLISLAISVDGLSDTHNRVRGLEHAYASAMKTLERLKAIAADHKNFTFGIETVVNKHNVEQLDENYERNMSITHHFNFTPAIYSSFYGNVNGDFAITEQQKPVVMEFYKKLSLRSPHLAYFYDQVLAFLKNGRRHYPCLGGTLTARLDPSGKLYPCLMMDRVIASPGEDYEKKWFGMDTGRLRREIPSCGLCQKCLNSCDMLNNYYYQVFHVLVFYLSRPRIMAAFISKLLQDRRKGGYYSQMLDRS